MQIDYKQVGYRLRAEREKFGLTRESFSELIEISPHYLGQIERGERKISINVLISSASCLRTSTDYLLFGSNDNVNLDDDFFLLLQKCSNVEFNVIKKVIKILLPHLK